MRFPRELTALSTTLLLGAARAAHAAQAPMKLEVTTSNSHTVWYTDPVWLGLGAVVFLIVVVLAIVASRNRDVKTTTTVIR